MPVKDKYISGYAAGISAAARFQQIQKTVADEIQQNLEYEKLIADEADTLAKLEETLRVKVNPLDTSAKLLGDLYGNQILAQRAGAQFRTQQRIEATAPVAVTEALATRDNATRVINTKKALNKILSAPQNYTRAQWNAALNAARAKGIGISNELAAGADKTWKKPTQISAAARQADETLRGALEAVVLGSEVGFVGGFDGEARAAGRAETPAPEGSSFITEADAFNRYLEALEDGDPSDLAEAVSPEDFNFAERVYRDAKANGAYQRRQAKFFEPTWIEQAKRLKDTKERAAAAQSRMAGRTPEQEVARRELLARGLNPDDKYLEFQGTPDYEYYTSADNIYDSLEGQPIKAITVPQRRVKALLDQYSAYDTDWDIGKLEKELKKFVPEKELAGAIGWALAYDRIKEEGQKTPSQLELQKQFEAKQKAAAEAEAKELEQDVARAQQQLDKVAAATTSMSAQPDQPQLDAGKAAERTGVYIPLVLLDSEFQKIQDKIGKPVRAFQFKETLDPRTNEPAIFVSRAIAAKFNELRKSDNPADLEKAVQVLAEDQSLTYKGIPRETLQRTELQEDAAEKRARLEQRQQQLVNEYLATDTEKKKLGARGRDKQLLNKIEFIGKQLDKLPETQTATAPVTPKLLEPVPSRLRPKTPVAEPFAPPAAVGLNEGTTRTAPRPPAPPAPVTVIDPNIEGYEFVDLTDKAGSRYKVTATGFRALSGPYAGRDIPRTGRAGRALRDQALAYFEEQNK